MLMLDDQSVDAALLASRLHDHEARVRELTVELAETQVPSPQIHVMLPSLSPLSPLRFM